MKYKEKTAYDKGYRVTENCQLLNPRGRELHPSDNKGYPAFKLRAHSPSILVHRLAAYQKFGSKLYTPGIEVRHRVNDTHNFRPSNLLLGTKKQNSQDVDPLIRLQIARNAARFRRKLTDDQVERMREEHTEGDSYSVLMRRYGIARGTVSYIINKKTYNSE
jgi:hypothetical protein